MPSESAALPVMLRYVPGRIFAGFTSYRTPKSSVVSPKFQPALNAVMFAATSSGRAANLRSRNVSVEAYGREYIQESSPSANMFFARSASFLEISCASSDLIVIEVSATGCSAYASSEPSSSGFASYPTLARLRRVNSSVFTMMSAPRGRSSRFALSAAGFIATSTFGASPGVRMS
jgi:hypothetical protein